MEMRLGDVVLALDVVESEETETVDKTAEKEEEEEWTADVIEREAEEA